MMKKKDFQKSKGDDFMRANALCFGDVFLFEGIEFVAIDNYNETENGNFLWVTNRNSYINSGDQTSTTATLITLYPDDCVELIENISD